MTILGIDIGTTTISAAVLKNGTVAAARTLPNHSFINTERSWEKIQDPRRILSSVLALLREMLEIYPGIERIGITGQQHGILYLDTDGNPVSPLYTWQDRRGDLPFQHTESYAGYLSKLTDTPLSTGFGIVTHFYNLKNGLIPQKASVFCTIADYIAMKLAELPAPLVHPSNAASFGLFDLKSHRFCSEKLENSGITPEILPVITSVPCIGLYKDRIPVYAAIGDNQASFIGATQSTEECMLINIGTGAQFSIYSKKYAGCTSLETRPFINNDYLLVGSSLCGGRAYALLESFFRSTAEMALGCHVDSCYPAMSDMLEKCPEPDHLPVFAPFFQGSRDDPYKKAYISDLDTENFHPVHLTYAIMYGMIDELYSMYKDYIGSGLTAPSILYGSGNGLRQNPHLRRIAEKRFGLPLILSDNQEEAACGAALFAQLSSPDR